MRVCGSTEIDLTISGFTIPISVIGKNKILRSQYQSAGIRRRRIVDPGGLVGVAVCQIYFQDQGEQQHRKIEKEAVAESL